MRKYLHVIKTTFNDSIQYASSILFKFIGFLVIMFVMLNLWSYIYGDTNNIIKGYSLTQMLWYVLLAELITFSSGSKVATDEVRDTIKSGNIAYQVNKPYNYITYTFCKYIADTSIRAIMFTFISIVFGLIFIGPYNINISKILILIPIFILAIIITGLIRILISLLSFWVEDSKPFQMVYQKIVLIFGILFPIEMFPKIVGNIIRYTPIYSVAYGPAKLGVSFNKELLKNVLISQGITIIIIFIIISILYRIGVKKLNVNGG